MGSSHKVDIGGLLAGGRQQLLVNDAVPLEPFEGVRFEEPATVHLDLRAAGGMLEVTGTIDAVGRGECDYCLGAVERPVHVDVDERIETAPESQADPFGESNVLSGDRLDVADLTTQLVCSALPLGMRCSDDCKGICPQCGENRNTGACACPQTGTANNGENRGELKMEDPAQ